LIFADTVNPNDTKEVRASSVEMFDAEKGEWHRATAEIKRFRAASLLADMNVDDAQAVSLTRAVVGDFDQLSGRHAVPLVAFHGTAHDFARDVPWPPAALASYVVAFRNDGDHPIAVRFIVEGRGH
jgi:hypothetical protein